MDKGTMKKIIEAQAKTLEKYSKYINKLDEVNYKLATDLVSAREICKLYRSIIVKHSLENPKIGNDMLHVLSTMTKEGGIVGIDMKELGIKY